MKPMKSIRRFLRSFVYAFRGLAACVREERNFRFHLAVMLHLLVYLPFFTLSRAEICLLFLLCGLVIGLEAVNSAIERAVNCTGEISPRAGAAKDMAAGGVLVAAVTAVVCGVILLWQPTAFAAILRFFLRYPVAIPVQIAALAAVVLLIRKP